MIATATDLASAGFASNPAVHVGIAGALVLAGLATYFVRRRRNVDRDLDGPDVSSSNGDAENGKGR